MWGRFKSKVKRTKFQSKSLDDEQKGSFSNKKRLIDEGKRLESIIFKLLKRNFQLDGDVFFFFGVKIGKR